jgi:rod shape-determining protein MreC
VNFFRRYSFIIFMVVFLVGALTIFSINATRNPEETISGRLVLELTGPVQQAASSLGASIGAVWNHYFNLVHTARLNEDLQKEISGLRLQLVELEELRQENLRLGALLKLQTPSAPPQIAAMVVGWDASNNFRTAIINKGANQGVFSQMAVINSQGVVGRVVWSSPNYAKILLLIDSNSAIDALVQRSRARGIVEGAGDDKLRLKYIMHADEVAVGDTIIASGVEGIFPKGALVGKIRAISHATVDMFLAVELEPAVEFERLEEVAVIMQRRDLDN